MSNLQDINEKVLSLNYGEFRPEIKSVDAQESLNEGVHVLVTGYLTGKDNLMRNFAQSFFLAPQERGGYFVLNDMFRYVDKINIHNENQVSVKDDVASATLEQGNKIILLFDFYLFFFKLVYADYLVELPVFFVFLC